MESIQLIRKDSDSHRQVMSARSTAEARAVLDQWDQRPVLDSRSSGRKGGLRIQKKPGRKR